MSSHVPGTVFHIFSRGNHREPIFGSPRAYQRFLATLILHAARHHVTVLAFCFMPNHFHLLVRVGAVPLGTFMQSWLLSHAKWWNTKHDQTGHLFQGRYHAIICDRDEYLLEVVRYIHLNPVKAKLTRQLSGWPWSSLAAYLDGAYPWVDTTFVLNQWSEHRTQAVARFRAFLEADLKGPVPQWEVKEGRYVMEIEPARERSQGPTHEKLKKIIVLPDELPSLDDQDLLAMISQAEGISVEELLGQGRGAQVVNIRWAVAEAVRQWWAWEASRAARLLHKDPSTIAKIYGRYGKKLPREVKSMIVRWKALLLQRSRPA